MFGQPGRHHFLCKSPALRTASLSCCAMQVSTLGDDLMTWRILVSRFDEDTAAGRALNRDLLAVGCMYGCFHLVLEARWVPCVGGRAGDWLRSG
jgi:hypothetical protein